MCCLFMELYESCQSYYRQIYNTTYPSKTSVSLVYVVCTSGFVRIGPIHNPISIGVFVIAWFDRSHNPWNAGSKY